MLRKILLPLVLLQLAAALYAEDELWIDFGALPPGYLPEAGVYVRQYDPAPIQADDPTVLDYTNVYDPITRSRENLLPSRFEDQTAKNGVSAYTEMKHSLALDRWQIKFSGSSNFIDSRKSAQTLAYKVKDSSSRFAGEQIMAVYFSLPDLQVNSKVWVMPEFPIPAYSVLPGTDLMEDSQLPATERMGQFLNKGVLRNVGTISSITATVYGRRFPLTLTVEAYHSDIGQREYPMGSLQFSGWQDLVWNNPNYITDVRKREYKNSPEYPRGMPSMIFQSLRLDRPQHKVGKDTTQIVFYIKEIRVVYDESISETFDTEIDDETIWQLSTINAQRRSYQSARKSSLSTVDLYNELQQRHELFPAQEGGQSSTAAATTETQQPTEAAAN